MKERKKKMLPICRNEFLHMYVQVQNVFFFHIYSFSPSGVGRGGSLIGRDEDNWKR